MYYMTCFFHAIINQTIVLENTCFHFVPFLGRPRPKPLRGFREFFKWRAAVTTGPLPLLASFARCFVSRFAFRLIRSDGELSLDNFSWELGEPSSIPLASMSSSTSTSPFKIGLPTSLDISPAPFIILSSLSMVEERRLLVLDVLFCKELIIEDTDRKFRESFS